MGFVGGGARRRDSCVRRVDGYRGTYGNVGGIEMPLRRPDITDSAPIATLDTEIISTPVRIRRRSRISQLICVPAASLFGKAWQWRLLQTPWRGSKLVVGGDFAAVTGYYRAVVGDFKAWWNFTLGIFTGPGAMATAFQIVALTALSCGEFG